nr:hypothetical protein [Tanacetum cinerariifolium]GFA13443.1 hypothetical protein [Tanacetum cinerariifolium]
MNPNQSYEERNKFEDLTRKSIYHERDDAEARLMRDYFIDGFRTDATGQLSFSSIMKCTSAIRQLAYGTAPDAFDEYLQMDTENVYARHEYVHGFPGMLESIDCMHWEWKNYSVSWQEQYAGTNNNINVLDNSTLFDDLLDDIAHVAPFVVNGVGFKKGYYLADVIYPQLATFVKSFRSQMTRNMFSLKSDKNMHERMTNVLLVFSKDVEKPARQYHVNKIRRIMYSCIIMNNMILEDQEFAISEYNDMFVHPGRNM